MFYLDNNGLLSISLCILLIFVIYFIFMVDSKKQENFIKEEKCTEENNIQPKKEDLQESVSESEEEEHNYAPIEGAYNNIKFTNT